MLNDDFNEPEEVAQMVEILQADTERKATAEKNLQDDHKYLQGRYGVHIPDFDTLDNDPKIVEQVKKGATLREAWEAQNPEVEKRIQNYMGMGYSRERALQAEAKYHKKEKPTEYNKKDDEVYLSPEKLEVWRKVHGYTEQQAIEAEKRAIERDKKQRAVKVTTAETRRAAERQGWSPDKAS